MRASSAAVVLALLLAVVVGDLLAVPAAAAGAPGNAAVPAIQTVLAVDPALAPQQPPETTTAPATPTGTGTDTSAPPSGNRLLIALVAAALFGLVYFGRKIRKGKK
jgi:outer membrane biosynthesis protein TonB